MSTLLVALAGDDTALAEVERVVAELRPVPGLRRVLLTWSPDDPSVPLPAAANPSSVDAVLDLGALLDPGHPDSWHSEGELAERGLLLRALTAALGEPGPLAGSAAPTSVDVVVSGRPDHPATASLLRLFPEAVLRPEPPAPEPIEAEQAEPAPLVVVSNELAAAAVVTAPPSFVRRACRSVSRRTRSLR